jgi:hypothetical protein
LKTTGHLHLECKRIGRPGGVAPVGDAYAKYRPVLWQVQERKVLGSDVHRCGLSSSLNLRGKSRRSRKRGASVDDFSRVTRQLAGWFERGNSSRFASR